MKTSEKVAQKLQEISLPQLLENVVTITDENNDTRYAFYYAYDGNGNVDVGFCNYITNEDNSWKSAFETQSGIIVGYYSWNEIEFGDAESEIVKTLENDEQIREEMEEVQKNQS